MAVASLVLGIISIVAGIFGGLLPGAGTTVGFITGIVGIILGVLGKKEPEKAGMAKAGMVCSIIGLVLSVLFLVACASCLGAAGIALSDL